MDAKQTAYTDWLWLAQFAKWHDYGDKADYYAPAITASAATIEKRITKLRKVCGYNGPLPSQYSDSEERIEAKASAHLDAYADYRNNSRTMA